MWIDYEQAQDWKQNPKCYLQGINLKNNNCNKTTIKMILKEKNEREKQKHRDTSYLNIAKIKIKLKWKIIVQFEFSINYLKGLRIIYT